VDLAQGSCNGTKLETGNSKLDPFVLVIPSEEVAVATEESRDPYPRRILDRILPL